MFDILNAGPRHRYTVMTALGPVVAHNCVQAIANDLLRAAMRGLDGAVLHIHDEIVLEVRKADADAAAARLAQVMTTPPAWATGLPLAAEVKIKTRFGK